MSEPVFGLHIKGFTRNLPMCVVVVPVADKYTIPPQFHSFHIYIHDIQAMTSQHLSGFPHPITDKSIYLPSSTPANPRTLSLVNQ